VSLFAGTLLFAPLRGRAQGGESAPLSAADYNDEQRLGDLLWNRSLEVRQARGQVALAASEVTRAQLYPNPDLEFTWGTIPIGQTNPPDLKNPLAHVPNYGVVLSELLELFKRDPRRQASEAELSAARYESQAVYADRFFDLLHSLGEMAKSKLKASLLDGQIDVYDALLSLERQRLGKGDIAAVDVDREEVERARLAAARDSAQAELETARAECAALLATDCPPFATGDDAGEFLRVPAEAEFPAAWSNDIEARRPDIAALGAAGDAADQRITLAKRKAIPDVTVKVGYLYDTFLTAGNQNQSVSFGLEMPLPVADRGQADLQQADALRDRARSARQLLISGGALSLGTSRQQLALARDRIARLRDAEHKASELEKSVTGAARQGGASQVDVLLARRAYQDLLVESADVRGDAFDASLKIRRAAALFPPPPGDANIGS